MRGIMSSRPSPVPWSLWGEEPCTFPTLPTFRRLNVWSLMDTVRGPLHFYRLEEADRVRRWYWIRGFAHLAYRDDLKLYGPVAEGCL